MSLDTLIEQLPHKDPFLFVTHLSEMESGKCTGTWDVSGDEWFLRGHFPDQPIVPGVLITEARLCKTALRRWPRLQANLPGEAHC